MEYYLPIRILHGLAAVLLIIGLPVHLLIIWKAWRAADPSRLAHKLRNSWRYSVPAFALALFSLPLSGWWMVDLAGWPLGSTWLLLSSILYIPLAIAGLLLARHLYTWQALGEQSPPRRLLRQCLLYSGSAIFLLLAIAALMGSKPL